MESSFSNKQLAKHFLETIPPCMHLVRKLVRAEAKSSLTIPQLRILANINRGQKHICEIAEHHGVSQPAMSRMVDCLEKKRLIKKRPDPEDGRGSILSLTPKGQRLFLKVRQDSERRLEKMLESLSSNELSQLSDSLEQLKKIATHLKDKQL